MQWVMRASDGLRFWRGDTLKLDVDTTQLRIGGHFPGATILHCAADDGMLLTGDVLQVTPERKHVSFMYSYPNYMPLSARQVRGIGDTIEKLCFERVYGSFAHAAGCFASPDRLCKRESQVRRPVCSAEDEPSQGRASWP